MNSINSKWFIDIFNKVFHVRTKVTYIVFVLAMMLIILGYLLFSTPYGTGNSDANDESGLYSKKDKIQVLNVNNFDHIYNSTNAWLVQFYNSWCGHCINFSPVYKKFAGNVYNWQKLVAIGAINCADDENTQLCRDFEIMRYPTILYFHPFTTKRNVAGNNFQKYNDIVKMRKELADMLETSQIEGWAPDDWPNMRPIDSNSSNTFDDIRTNANNDRLFVVVEQSNSSYLGLELILDTFAINDVTVRRTFNRSSSYPALYVVNSGLIQIPLTNASREIAYRTLATFANANYDRSIPIELFPDDSRELSTDTTTVSTTLLVSSLTNKVYTTDLENAVRYSLFHEIPLKPFIDRDARNALYRFLDALSKFMPFRNRNFPLFLDRLKEKIHNDNNNMDVAVFSGEQFRLAAVELETVYSVSDGPLFTSTSDWYGCRGSTSKYRGYPCGLWTLAHTLTVRANGNVNASKEVLLAFEGYIKYFFGCNECADNFLKMSPSIHTDVANLDDGVLWLWRAHNRANARLKGDPSEDPQFPKVQFPSKEACPDCRKYDVNDTWIEVKVLNFLRTMYRDIMSPIPNEMMKSMHGNHNNHHTMMMMLSNVRTSSGNSIDNYSTDDDVYRKGSAGLFGDVNIGIGLYILFMLALVAYIVKIAFTKRQPVRNSFKYNSNNNNGRHRDFVCNKV